MFIAGWVHVLCLYVTFLIVHPVYLVEIMITYGVYSPIYFIARKALFYIFVHSFIIPSFISMLVLS